MTPPVEVCLEQRREDYALAKLRAIEASEVYLEARASGLRWGAPFDEMDAAQAELRRAKRRLEQTERRIAKRTARR